MIKPTTKAACRVYMAKDLNSYRRQYYNVMHQLIGARWNPVMQNLDYDAFMLKRVVRLILALLLLLLVGYIYLG